MKRIRVLIIDDSALVRAILTEIINAAPDMTVVGVAPDPLVARELIRSLDPDVLTLDVEMPRMDGLDFLERLMRLKPMPVVMVSTLTERGSDVTLRALELGAVDFVSKPKVGIAGGLKEYADDITGKIREASRARVKRVAVASVGKGKGDPSEVKALSNRVASTERLLLIGASTGGTEAIKAVLQQMPPDAPGILVTQHMPEAFTKAFAARLDGLCKIKVSEAGHGERILPGHAFIAPGHSHLLVRKSGANYITELSQAPPVNRHRPAVDVLFQSAAQCAGRNAIGVILTGMGKDGAIGMRQLHDTGAHTVAQDEASCVVFGMPGAAIAQGGVDEVLPLNDISPYVLKRLAESGGRTNRV